MRTLPFPFHCQIKQKSSDLSLYFYRVRILVDPVTYYVTTFL